MALTWNEDLRNKLLKKYGQKKGAELYTKYEHAFPHSYSDDYSVSIALNDIECIEKVSEQNPLQVCFYNPKKDAPEEFDLKLFQWQEPIPLSDILPTIENFDLRTINERPHQIKFPHKTVWISDYLVTYNKTNSNMEKARILLEKAFPKIYYGVAENDGFNKLILSGFFSYREVSIFRAYAKYLRQVGFRFSQDYIQKALLNNLEITKNLLELFFALHDPESVQGKAQAKIAKSKKEAVKKIRNEINLGFDKVVSLDEDKILRQILVLIEATLRTNYFQKTRDLAEKDYISIKLNSRQIPGLPLPMPLYEIFVYSPRFEGIHLRNTKVARGGIRWSDRSEDFRTEILGLMKAQTVKNAVIVPSGAKGGFVLKKAGELKTRDALQAEVIYCYTTFIKGLLDLTDNIIDKKFVPPKDVVCYDEPDPYLVVAADKGTSTFSDIANGISKEYQFWLSDAFASGGATGYDHKKMGITARGAWESIKRHFRELNIEATKANITVIGIGDMSGDVFGNGMIYSKNIKLVAAFDHRDIFIDPNPNPEVSYYERVRLFNLPLSSWQSYNPKIISKGGGVFSRSLKSIPISAEMRAVLQIEDKALAPNDLVKAILMAPVDLFYNGGIGTYVKASTETQLDAGDRTNDYCRIDGNEVRAKVVGEGGNLGFTQLGRVEYALKGGLIYTDFIDNSAGVDCSDHEVNLKILLDGEINKGRLTEKKRNQVLESLTDEVAHLVLDDNYEQALVMSFTARASTGNIGLHTTYIQDLENKGVLNRKVEFLPTDKQLLERKAAEVGLTRPELAILLAYSKIDIKHEILKTNIPEDPYLQKSIERDFPEGVRHKYQNAMIDHRLYRDIIATQISNEIVNQMGITFVYRMHLETGAMVDEIIRAYTIASQVFETSEVQKKIESLDFKIPVTDQYEMLYNIRHLINLSTRWFLHSPHVKAPLAKVIEHFRENIRKLENLTPQLMSGYTKDYLNSLTSQFLKVGLKEEFARKVATYRAIYTSLNIIEIASKNKFDLLKTAMVYFASGERINLVWFRDVIAKDNREGHWNVLARLSLRDELDIAQRALTVSIISFDKKEKDPNVLIEKWVRENHRAIKRWDKVLAMLHGTFDIEYTMFFIAIRELISLVMVEDNA